MSDTMMAQHLRPGHIVETPDCGQFTVRETVQTWDAAYGGSVVRITWTDGMVEHYNAEDTFDVIGERLTDSQLDDLAAQNRNLRGE